MVMFNYPFYLILAVIILPGFIILSFLLHKHQKLALDKFGARQTNFHLSKSSSKTATTLLFSLALTSLAVAAAEPNLMDATDFESHTLNAIIVLDVSRSMLTRDGPQEKTRLEMGILAAEHLLDAYPDGRFGLVLFTNTVSDYYPTNDHQALKILMRQVLETYNVRGKGSNATPALIKAVAIIEDTPYKVDTVFLISDGGKSLIPSYGDSTSPLLLEKIKALKLHLVVGGVGGLIPAPIPLYNKAGELTGYHRFHGEIVYTSLDEISLQNFAKTISGYYQRLSDPKDLVNIAKSERLDSQPSSQKIIASLIWLPILLSIFLIALWLLISNLSHLRPPRISFH